MDKNHAQMNSAVFGSFLNLNSYKADKNLSKRKRQHRKDSGPHGIQHSDQKSDSNICECVIKMRNEVDSSYSMNMH